MAVAEGERRALSVSSALALAKGALEDITVRIVGEVSELSMNPRYKAVYFTVKDASSALPCMMWNNRYSACGVELRMGALIEITGRFSLYAAKGRMNFDVFSIELAGEGKLRMQVAQLAKRLRTEGLMEPTTKKPIPSMPERIGVVTSPRGAAVYDVLRTLRRRFPLADVVIAGVTVEGKTAPMQIMEGLSAMEEADVDVVLLVRGGGSFEDLMPFNDEALARRIAAMGVPVVTGIGHEPDTSIADMVSDLRASTPTAAAESVVPSSSELAARIASIRMRLDADATSRLRDAAAALDRLAASSALSDPMRIVSQDAMRLDDLARRLPAAIPSSLSASRVALDVARTRLASGLRSLVSDRIARTAAMRQRLVSDGRTLAMPFSRSMGRCAASLEALSPLAVLGRGYAIARDGEECILKGIDGLEAGDRATVQLAHGSFACTIDSLSRTDMAWEEIDG